MHLLFPDVTSFANSFEFAYSAGLMNPTEPLPILIRAAFKLDIMPAIAGAAADVPEERVIAFPLNTR